MKDFVGSTFGDYKILRRLGGGGFADVYLGEHKLLGSQDAIKILHEDKINAYRDLFLQEARIAKQLHHSNIIPVLNCGTSNDDIPFLVMDYAIGGSLRAYLTKNGPLPLLTILSYAQQIASALQYVHEKGLVHRDVKPENILLGQQGEVLLADFGIATITDTILGKTQDIAGTIAYMAPEHLGGHPRRASDQYSLAVVVYEWISSVRPSFDDTLSLHEKVPGIPPKIEQVVLKALSKDYHDRFESVQAFAVALEEAFALPNESYYRDDVLQEDVAKAIYQYYYKSCEIMQQLGLPKPVSREDVRKKSPRRTEGYRRPFEHGAIYWTKERGALHIRGGFAELHDEYQGAAGILGFPLTAELLATVHTQVTHGVFQRFEGQWDYPKDVNTTPVPRCGATLYYCDQYGSFPTFGGIGICYERLGGTSGHLGFPTSHELDTEESYHGTKGKYQCFEDGIVYWSWKTDAHPVWGEIGEFYKNHKGITDRLGFPLSHEIPTQSSQGTKGVYQRFEGGPHDGYEGVYKGVSVYRSKHGTYPVWGGPGICYEQLGNVSSFLGFPISSEEELADKSPYGTEGWFQRFEGGAIFWCKAYEGIAVASSFLALHEEFGGIKGRFGFPTFPAKTSDSHPDQQLQEFEGGVIYLEHDARAKRWDNVNEVVEIVNRMYERILGRRTDEGALITYGSQLHRGERSVREIVKTLGQSPEYRRHLAEMTKTVEEAVKMCFEHFWGRKADESDMKTYVELAQAQDIVAVVDKLVDDEEYRNKFGENQVPG